MNVLKRIFRTRSRLITQRSAAALLSAGIIAADATAEVVKPFENCDFEQGSLFNWTAEGTAMANQPTKGDNTSARGNNRSNQQGQYWIGTYENYNGVVGNPGDVQGDSPVGSLVSVNFTITKPYLSFRVGAGSDSALVGVSLIHSGGETLLGTGADNETMRGVVADVSAFMGQSVQIKIFDNSSGGWGHINADDFLLNDEYVDPFATYPTYQDVGYDQTARPQFHFTSRKNWLNDPNGMVYYDGEYHLFFQHNPLDTAWGNMTWGHAVSLDMVHWKQLPHAITPYGGGTIFSGTAVVDHNNSLGMQSGSTNTLVACYTFAKNPFGQAMAYSTDRGRTFSLVNNGTPVVPNQGFSSDERDPKIFWHEPTQKWVMILWVRQGTPGRVRFFTSDNLTDWTVASDFQRNWVFECMDFVELTVDGDSSNKKWLLYDASFDYEIGTFDGTNFVSDAVAYTGDVDSDFYAAQTFNNSPDGRTVMIGWMRNSHFPDMPFSQQMSFPAEMTLRTTPEGVRLYRWPVDEIRNLYRQSHSFSNLTVDEANTALASIPVELLDFSIEFEPTADLTLNLRGLTVSYDAAAREFSYLNKKLTAAPVDGTVQLRVLVDRGSIELFANEGAVVCSSYVQPDPSNRSLSVSASGAVSIRTLEINELGSAWQHPPKAENVVITGTAEESQTLTGSYTYIHPEEIPETGTAFQWFRSLDPEFSLDDVLIAGATNRSYAAQNGDVGKYLFFVVSPCSVSNETVLIQSYSEASPVINAAGNARPVASPASIETMKATPVLIPLSATDDDGDSLSYSIVDGPEHGTVSIDAGAGATYTPDFFYFGTDHFTFVANDGTVDSLPAVVNITVTPVPVVPGQLLAYEGFDYPVGTGTLDSDGTGGSGWGRKAG